MNRQILLITIRKIAVSKSGGMVLVEQTHVKAVSEGRDVLQPGNPARDRVEFVVHSAEHHQRQQQKRCHA